MRDVRKEIARVQEIMIRAEKILQAFLSRTTDRDGPMVALSVASNMATTLMAVSMLMVERSGGSIPLFMSRVMEECAHKYVNLGGKYDGKLSSQEEGALQSPSSTVH